MNSRRNKDSGEAEVKGAVSGKRVARLFVTYWAIAFMVVVLSFYAIADLVTVKVAYILLAAVATLIHIRKGKKDVLTRS